MSGDPGGPTRDHNQGFRHFATTVQRRDLSVFVSVNKCLRNSHPIHKTLFFMRC